MTRPKSGRLTFDINKFIYYYPLRENKRYNQVMIHRFSVNNFQSIRQDVELDFRIPGTTPDRPCFRRSRSRSDIRLPSVVALIGPNGSGKTALLCAMAAAIRFAVYSYDHSGPGNIPDFLPFLSTERIAARTRIEIDFDARWLGSGSGQEDTLFRYTLELNRDGSNLAAARVGYEALHHFPRGRPRRVVERRMDKPIYIAREMKVRPRDDRLSSIPPNASVISALAKMGVESFSVVAADIGNVQMNIAGPEPWKIDTETVIRYYRDHQDLRGEISNKLRRFDLGIENMQVRSLPDGKWLIVFEHNGLDEPVALINESSGTRHLVHAFPQFHFVLNTGHLAIMDALDSDFHTELSAEILGWFRRKETNPNKAQLICSLHNLSVLDGLEKEEVFIVEKDSDGATRVHGARDVAGLRRDGNLQKHYRSGVMGGLPTFG